MYHRLKILYFHHFKLVGVLNCCLSLFFVYLFVLKGFDKVNLYNLAIFFKLLAYGLTIAIEKLFFAQRAFYYRNLGISYRRLLGTFFSLDAIVFTSFMFIGYICRSFI